MLFRKSVATFSDCHKTEIYLRVSNTDSLNSLQLIIEY